MTRNPWRRTLLNRLLTNRVPRRARIGACTVCGVVFAGSLDQRAHVEQILRVHQSICPGGRRAGDVVTPFE